MSNLIPTPIVDKNGKQTTVHKKQQTSTSSAKKIPALTAKKPLKAEMVEAAAHQFATEYVDSQGPSISRDAAYRMIHNDVLKGLKKCSVDTIQKILGPTMNEHRRSTLANGLGDGWDEQMVNDYMNVAPVLESHNLTYKEHKSFLISLEYFKDMETLKRGKYPEERASQSLAVTKVMTHIYDNPHSTADINLWKEFQNGDEWEEVPYIEDDNLRNLLLSPEQDREAIVDLILERSIFDADQIKDILSLRDTPALGSGAL